MIAGLVELWLLKLKLKPSIKRWRGVLQVRELGGPTLFQLVPVVSDHGYVNMI